MSDTETRLYDGMYVFGTEFGVRFSTETVEIVSGATFYNANWSSGLGEGNLGNRIVTQAELNEIVAFFRARKGRAGRFRVRDVSDYQVTVANCLLSPTQGVGGPTYQAYKRYSNGGTFEDRKITKLAGTIALFRNAVAVTAGAGAGNYAVDLNSGIFTFVQDSSSGASSHTVGASHVVTLGAALSGLVISGKLWLDGVTGTAAATLNNKAHTISNVAGAVYTLAVSTTGLTATGGTGRKYPQPTDVLTYSSEFDIPAHFAVDSIRWRLDAVDTFKNEKLFFLESIPLVEERAP